MSSPSHLTIPVSLLSGKRLEVRLQSTDTAEELLARVEQQLGESPPLHDVQLYVGQERLGAGAPVAELAARLAGGGCVVQALLLPSASKAMAYIVSECGRMQSLSILSAPEKAAAKLATDVAKNCSPALDTLLEANVSMLDLENFDFELDYIDHAISIIDMKNRHVFGVEDAADVLSCRRFAGLAKLLTISHVRGGRRQLDPRAAGGFFRSLFDAFDTPWTCVLRFHWTSPESEELNEVVVAAIRDPEWHHLIGTSWQQATGEGGMREAMEWLATEHKQEVVRAAAAEAIAAHLGPRTPEAPPPARGAAAGAAAEAPVASDEQEVEQVAEAIEQSEAEAIQQEQELVQEALLRSIVGLAAVAVDVVLLKYNHCQKWLIDALSAAGCTQLRSGAMVLVPPGVHAAVVDFFEDGWDLKTSHVVVASELEVMVHGSVDAAQKALLRSERRNTRITNRKAITVPDDVSVEVSEDTAEYEVVKTFVHVPVPSSMRSASSFHHGSV